MSLEPDRLNKERAHSAPSERQLPEHHPEILEWWPHSPGVLKQLGVPRELEPAPSPTGDKEASGWHNDRVPWRSRTARFIATAFTSNNTYSMIGNLIIASHLQFGMHLQLACAGLAVWNEMREREVRSFSTEPSRERSWADFLKALVLSPGVYRYTLSAAFVANAIEHGPFNFLGLGSAFLFLGAGNLCVANDINRSYFRRLGITKEPDCRSQHSPTLRSVLTLLSNGAVYWGIADVLVGLDGLHRVGLDLRTAPPLFAIGVASALLSVASVVALSRRNPNSPWPFGLNAATNYIFGLANLWYIPSAEATAAAVSMWGTGSVLLAVDKYRSTIQGKKV